MITNVLAMRITEDFAAAVLNGRMHSAFTSAVNLAFPVPDGPGRLITVLPPRFSGVPDSLVVTEAAFQQLASAPVDTPVRKQGLLFQVPYLAMDLDGRGSCQLTSGLVESTSAGFVSDAARLDIRRLVDFQQALADFRQSGVPADGFMLAPPIAADRIRQVLVRFARFWLLGDSGAAMAELPQCLGWGHGLTPSADDALVGILALAAGARQYAGWPLPVEPLRLAAATTGRTTDVSRKYLLCAQEGRFADVLRQLVRAVFQKLRPEETPDAWTPLLAAVADVGGTSGLDMLMGVAIGCQILSELKHQS